MSTPFTSGLFYSLDNSKCLIVHRLVPIRGSVDRGSGSFGRGSGRRRDLCRRLSGVGEVE